MSGFGSHELHRPPKRIIRKILEYYERFHDPAYLGIDPLITLQRFTRRADREIGGLIAAVLSYGRVETIIAHLEALFSIMGNRPHDFTINTPLPMKRTLLRDFRHRFTNGEDMALLLEAVASILGQYGSIESFFTDAVAVSSDGMAGAIDRFSTEVKRQASLLCEPLPEYLPFLVPSPRAGSACKRMNMYLRWMIRPADGIDFGVWKSIAPSLLIMPVDTHIARVARGLGLTSRTAADWRMALEITAMLRCIDADDPVRFDFSLCRSGMIETRRSAA